MKRQKVIGTTIFLVTACTILGLLGGVWTRPAQGAGTLDEGEVCPYPEEMTFEQKEEYNLNNSWNLPHCFSFPTGSIVCIPTWSYRDQCPDRFPPTPTVETGPYPGPVETAEAYPGIPEAVPGAKKLDNVGKGGIPEPTATNVALLLEKPERKRLIYNPFEAIREYFDSLIRRR